MSPHNEVWLLENEEQTAAAAREIAARLHGGETLGLSGDLGAGKTTFTRYLCAALGIRAGVSSPSYVLCNEYTGGRLHVEHWDLYRVSELPEELYERPHGNSLRIIEWWERAPEIRNDLHYLLEFAIVANETRKLSITTLGNAHGRS